MLKHLLLRIVFVVLSFSCIVMAFDERYSTVTVYMPDAGLGSQPLCISNRGTRPVMISHGPTLAVGQSVTASVVTDFQWGFTTPAPASDRADVDCVVIAR
jgi:hypothetical protein